MSPRKRFLAKLELDPTQRKITHYFPKSENWKHDFTRDFTLTIPMKKTLKRTILLPEVIATIELYSSDDDEFQASNYTRDDVTSTVKAQNGVNTHGPKKRKPRKKRTKKKNYIKIRQPEAANHETIINCAEFVEKDLETELVQHTLCRDDRVEKLPANIISSERESVDIEVNLLGSIPSTSREVLDVSHIDNEEPAVDSVSNSQHFVLPILSQISRSTRIDSVCINKPKILINSPEKSKSIILQANTLDLFCVDDDVEDSPFKINNNKTAIPSTNILDETETDVSNDNANLYLESFASSNKENSPEVCNTLIEDCRFDNLMPKSEPMNSNNSIDITIEHKHNLETEESIAMDTTLIKDYVKLNNGENIHDVLVELHHALDRMENTEAIDPNSPYYKMFFLRKVIRNVVGNFDMLRLLRDVERRTLVMFLQMDTKYQYFCFRLFTRLPKWYNMYKLIETIKLDMHPKEISDMYACLQENNFIQTDYSQESISTLLHLLERSALTRIHSNFKIKRSKYITKESIIDSLIAFCNSQTTLSSNFRPDQVLYKLISEEMGPCAKLENNFYTTLSRVHLLNMFTNHDLVKVNDLYFLMAQIEKGEIILPSYDVESAIGNIFPRRQDFLLYSKAAEYKNQFVLKMEKTGKSRDWNSVKDICDASFLELQKIIHNHSLLNNSDIMNRYSAGYKYASIISEATKQLTKAYTDDVEKWLHFLLQQRHFCQKRRGLWYDRLAMIKSAYKKEVDQAAEIVLKGLDDGFVTESGRREILNRAVRLMKRKTNKVRDDLLIALKMKTASSIENKYSVRNIQGKQQPGNQGKCYFLEYDGEHHTYYNVEEYSIKHYTTDLSFTDGVHCEGALFATLFSVLFWDVIYDEYTAGAFINNLQVYPLDYFTKDFYANREDAIDGRLEQIAAVWSPECFELTIRNNFEGHRNKRCGIASNLFQSGEQLVTIAKCIGRESLAVVMKRMVLNMGDMCAGLPDLFVWNSLTYKCKFVEVKSEKDVLSMKQILWLNFLISANLDAEVCHVLPSIDTSNVPASKRATVE